MCSTDYTGGMKIPFKKQFSKEDFKNALSSEWQKTSDIAKKVGCHQTFVMRNLLDLYDVILVGKLGIYNVYNAVEIVEYKWVKGGRKGTREWRIRR